MKKLLVLAILSTISLAESCFGVDFVRDKIYLSRSTYIYLDDPDPTFYPAFALGYYYTSSIKITVELLSLTSTRGTFANLYYHPEITNTDVTPYIRAGIGYIGIDYDGLFSYHISSGVNLPLSSRTNVFAGYRLLGIQAHPKLSHGPEFGINFNL